MMDWNIQARAHACQDCGRAFANGDVYHTALFEEQAVYHRQDLCAQCWSARSATTNGARAGYLSHWQGVFEAPTPQPELIRKESAETLLRKLIERGDPDHMATVFILGVMLERKRLLKVKDQVQQDGRRYLVYEHSQTGDVFTIADPALSLDQLDDVQRDVARLLEHGLSDTPNLELAPPQAGISQIAPDPSEAPTEFIRPTTS